MAPGASELCGYRCREGNQRRKLIGKHNPHPVEIRNEHPALSNGSLELINDLPNGVLGYIRRINENEIAVLLNFFDKEKIVAFRNRNWREVLKLQDDEITGETIQLKGFSGVILQRQ